VLIAGAALLIGHAVRRSFVPYLTELIALGLGIALALVVFPPVRQYVHDHIGLGLGVAGVGCALIIIVAVHALVQGTVNRFAHWLDSGLEPGGLRTTIASIPALGVAVGVAVLVLPALLVVPLPGLSAVVTGSLLGAQVVKAEGPVGGRVQELLAPANTDPKKILESDPVSNPGEDAFLKLQFPANLQIQPDPAGEDTMLQKVNQARAQSGLSPLRGDTLLQQAARQHSADMYQRHYFSHNTPDGKTPYDRLHDLRMHYVTAGENLAFAPDVDQAFTSLMNSPDHRANILNPDFKCVGIGAYKGLNGYEEMFTQDFSDCTQ
jgi:uncharacterized protein YkwD